MEESATAFHDVISRENLEEDLEELVITAMPGAPQHSTAHPCKLFQKAITV